MKGGGKSRPPTPQKKINVALVASKKKTRIAGKHRHYFILDIPSCRLLLQISIYLPSKQLFIDITVAFLKFMAACFCPHLGLFQANILHKIC